MQPKLQADDSGLIKYKLLYIDIFALAFRYAICKRDSYFQNSVINAGANIKFAISAINMAMLRSNPNSLFTDITPVR